MAAIIELKDVSKSFGRVNALRGISLKRRGEIDPDQDTFRRP